MEGKLRKNIKVDAGTKNHDPSFSNKQTNWLESVCRKARVKRIERWCSKYLRHLSSDSCSMRSKDEHTWRYEANNKTQ